MSEFATKLSSFFYTTPKQSVNPVYDFFVDSKAKDRKKVYLKALKEAQHDQQKVVRTAREKTRV